METSEKRTYTYQEMADYYGVDKRTLYNWLLPIRPELLSMYPREQKQLTILIPKQVKRIKELLG